MRAPLCVIVLSTGIALAQSGAPPSVDLRVWKLPSVSETKLENGLTIEVLQDNRLPIVSLNLAFAGGTRRDPKDRPGLAAIVAETLTLGTSNQASSQIVDNLSRTGASLTTQASADRLTLEGSVVPEGLSGLIAVVSDIVRGANFPQADLNLFLQNRRQALIRQASQLGYAANFFLFTRVFGEHPYARLVPPPIVPAIDSQILTSYRTTFLTPGNATLTLVGKVPPPAALQKVLVERFGSWSGAAPPALEPAKIAESEHRLILLDRPGVAAAEIRVGRAAPSSHETDYAAMIVALEIENNRLRKQGGPGIRVEPQTLDEATMLMYAAQTAVASTGETLGRLLESMAAVRKTPLAPGELADAKTAASSAYLTRIGTRAALASEIGRVKMSHLPGDYIETYTARLNAVTEEQVRAVAEKYLSANDAVIVIEGDAAKIQPQVSGIGSFEVIRQK